MTAHLGGVLGEPGGAHLFVRRVGGLAVGVVGGLGVDDDLLAAGQADNEIGTETAGRLLFNEVAIGAHARHLDDAAQLQLPPGAGGGGGAQRGGELGGLGLQGDLGGAERLQLFGKLAVGVGADFFHLADLGVHFLQRFLERLHQGIDGLLAFAEFVGRLLVEFAEGFARELEELIAVPAQRLGGEGLELVLQTLVGGGQRGDFFGRGGTFRGEIVLDFRFEALGFGQAGAGGGEVGLEQTRALSGCRMAALQEKPDEGGGRERGEANDGEVGNGKNHVKGDREGLVQIVSGCVP